MTEPMTLARFRGLADAYGGAIDRWPAEHRAAAKALAADPAAAAIIADAAALDDALDAWRTPAPADDLAARVAASAASARLAFVRRARLWWSGLGIATALAGAAAGTAAASALSPSSVPAAAVGAFGDLGADAGSDDAS